jgi:hypothetical protein
VFERGGLFKLVSLLLVLSFPCVAAAKADAGEWYADIHVYLDRAHNKLTVGQNKEALEGHDRKWETPIPKNFLVGGVSSFFYHPQWKQSSPHFWRDIRPLGKLPRIWEFTVKTQKPNVKVDLNWNLGRVGKGIGLYLKRKDDKEYINLGKQREYTYQSPLKKTVFLLKAEQTTSH